MIGTRDDLDLDWETVYAAAARTGTVLEMNGSPHRLDLSVERARRALEPAACCRSTRTPITPREFEHLAWGISQARRAWVTPADVLNTRSRAGLLAWLARQARARSSRAGAYHPGRWGQSRGLGEGESGARDLAIAVGRDRRAGAIRAGCVRLADRGRAPRRACSSAPCRSSREADPAPRGLRRPGRIADPARGRRRSPRSARFASCRSASSWRRRSCSPAGSSASRS